VRLPTLSQATLAQIPVRMQAFAEFYAAARYDGPRIVLISMEDWQLAEDLAADAFTKAWMVWRKVSRFGESGTSCNPFERGLFCCSSRIDL
jgi:DNA-directed RNA polymerase specialized sigma24 family protein